MDVTVKIICIVIILIMVFITISNFKLLIESNGGKKYFKTPKLKIEKPKIKPRQLVRLSTFLLMINHGPDLCVIQIDIDNIPYYKNINSILILGEKNDKN